MPRDAPVMIAVRPSSLPIQSLRSFQTGHGSRPAVSATLMMDLPDLVNTSVYKKAAGALDVGSSGVLPRLETR